MTDTISAEQYQEIIKAEKKKRPKYNNTKVERHGKTFGSIKEADRYDDLLLLEQAGAIADLETQVRYPLLGQDGTIVARYVADFTYYDKAEGTIVVEDVKSEITKKNPTYRLKKKLWESQYGMPLKEV